MRLSSFYRNNTYKEKSLKCNMKKVVSPLVLLVAILMITISISLVSSLTASISNPRMVLYKTLPDSEPLVFENSVIINNDNPDDVDIKITPIKEWEDKVTVEENEFVIGSGKRKEVFYTITIDKAGHYRGDVVVTFSEQTSNKRLSLAQDLVVIVQDGQGNVPDRSADSNTNSGFNTLPLFIWILAVSIILIILLIIILNLQKGKKK